MLRQTASQKMLQKLSPQQIQLMKLLQIPTATLEQRIKEELEANPALDEGDSERERAENEDRDRQEEEPAEAEREETFELDDYLQNYIDDDPSSYKTRGESSNGDEEDRHIPMAVENSYHEYLEDQLHTLSLKGEKEATIARQIIGSIDDDGYLRRSPESIADDLLFSRNLDVREEDVFQILEKIQRFDPPGTGARDLRECLLIQLDIKLHREGKMGAARTADLTLARTVIADYFEEFSKKHFDKLVRNLEVDDDDLRDAMAQILKLNPKPASGYSGRNRGGGQYVMPDFLISNRNGELELTLHGRNAPDLHVNDHYRDMLRSFRNRREKKQEIKRKDREAAQFIKQKIDSARWFIDAIQQRRNTLYNVMYALMQYQKDFFLSGDEKKLRPMILKDIADITSLDISTVSRVANSKFVQTEFGTFSLKKFFNESMSTTEGEEVSTLEVKKVLEEIIAAENKRKPLSDEKLMKALQAAGYDIARRTVAKYREQLGVAVARLRKEF